MKSNYPNFYHVFRLFTRLLVILSLRFLFILLSLSKLLPFQIATAQEVKMEYTGVLISP
jgi:hypothetical protein